MIKISVPATSANLSVGFDTLGIALNLYNTFIFEESDSFELVNFPEELNNEDNLVKKSYIDFFNHFSKSKDIKKVTITLDKQEIPVSRGLGSSASCILAGVFASNDIHHLEIPFDECVAFAAKLEGHSDNVFACAYGGLVASVELGGTYYYEKFLVNALYQFYLMIPGVKGSTKTLRSVLPKKVEFTDAVHNLSRMIFLPKAFEDEKFDLLKDLLSDKLHEEYRYPYIPIYQKIKSLSLEEDLIVCVSGSGPSLLVISVDDITNKLDEYSSVYEIKEVTVSRGIKIEVIT